MQDALFNKGLTLMLTGMGTVFVFLTLLVFMMGLMSRVLALLPAPVVAEPKRRSAEGEEEIAAISAAIALHRRRGQRVRKS